MSEFRTDSCGEIVTWNCSGLKVKHLAVVAALKEAGLDEGVARELAPRHAFSRACKTLAKERVIRQTEENDDRIWFQFTRETKVGDQFEYHLETMLELDKKSGRVSCPISELATLAQEELDRCIVERTGSDITRIVQKLFERNADLFSIRDQGGAYFVPESHRMFLESIAAFITGIDGKMRRFPILKGTDAGERSVREAVSEGLAAMLAEHEAAIEEFDIDTKDKTIERRAEKIKETRFKIEAYAEYLGGEQEKLLERLTALKDKLAAKIEDEDESSEGSIEDEDESSEGSIEDEDESSEGSDGLILQMQEAQQDLSASLA